MDETPLHRDFRAAPEEAGRRIDAWLAARLPDLSRARVQQLIEQGRVTCNGRPVKASHKLHPSDAVRIEVPPPAPPARLEPEALPIRVLVEDADLLALDKAPGQVVHPAPGHETGTLVHALLHHCQDLAGVGGERRPGLVHRLDKDTSGVLVVAKHERALRALQAQFKDRRTHKTYLALLHGEPRFTEKRVETCIGRSPTHRKKMAVTDPAHGRVAVSQFTIVERLRGACLAEVRIETGRTHQIRVHAAHLGHPVLGDPLYGRGARDGVPRQMLHAWRLSLRHPGLDRQLDLEAAPPPDFQSALAARRGPG